MATLDQYYRNGPKDYTDEIRETFLEKIENFVEAIAAVTGRVNAAYQHEPDAFLKLFRSRQLLDKEVDLLCARSRRINERSGRLHEQGPLRLHFKELEVGLDKLANCLERTSIARLVCRGAEGRCRGVVKGKLCNKKIHEALVHCSAHKDQYDTCLYYVQPGLRCGEDIEEEPHYDRDHRCPYEMPYCTTHKLEIDQAKHAASWKINATGQNIAELNGVVDQLGSSHLYKIVKKSRASVSTKCAICISEMLDGDEDEPVASLLCCGHKFHASCAETMFKTKQGWARIRAYKCPLCRTPAYHVEELGRSDVLLPYKNGRNDVFKCAIPRM